MASAPALRVLVVDDDPFVQEFLCFQAEHLGCQVTGASTLSDALAALASERFDAVVADVNLGSESSSPLLEAADAAGIRAITISASPYQGGSAAHLTKPVSTEDLARALEVPVERP